MKIGSVLAGAVITLSSISSQAQQWVKGTSHDTWQNKDGIVFTLTGTEPGTNNKAYLSVYCSNGKLNAVRLYAEQLVFSQGLPGKTEVAIKHDGKRESMMMREWAAQDNWRAAGVPNNELKKVVKDHETLFYTVDANHTSRTFQFVQSVQTPADMFTTDCGFKP